MSGNKQVGETPSSEVVNRFRSCRDLSDIVPLYPPRSLYLKPFAKINVSVNLPQLKIQGKTISTWEVMEKIRKFILPDEFSSLKVAKSTLEIIRLEGDLQDKSRLSRVLARLDMQHLNLAGFPNVLKIRAAEAKDDFPTRHSWDSYFRDAKHMNELKPGERPDTIHISGLPVKWFTDDGASVPSELLITQIFKKWGTLRRIDVPIADPYRPRMRLGNNIHKFSYEDGIFFDVYIQYVEYMDFVKAMDALRGMKLLKKDGQNSMITTIKVDFDKTKHMSDSSVSHREFERKRLIAQDNLAAEKLRKKEEAERKRREELKKKEEENMVAKESRQRKREEKRKRKALTIFRKQEEDKVSMKIAREEQKLIKAQRQLESIRLLDELFDRIKTKVEKKEIKLDQGTNVERKNEDKNENKNESNENKKADAESDKKNKEKQAKKKAKKKKKGKRKKAKKRKKDSGSDTSTDDDETTKETNNKKLKSVLIKNVRTSSSTDTISAANFAYNAYSDSMARISMLPPIVSEPFHRMPRSDMMLQTFIPGSYPRMPRGQGYRHGMGRGFFPPRYESYAMTNPYLYDGQYYEYFTHLANRDSKHRNSNLTDRRNRSLSLSRSRSKSRSASRSRNRRRSSSRSRSRGKRSRSASRSRSRRSRTRPRSRSRSRTKNRSRSRTKNRSRSRSRSRSRGRRKSKSRSISKKRTRSSSEAKRKSDTSSRSKRRSSSRSRSRSRSRTRRSRRKVRSRSRSRSRSSLKNRKRRRSTSVKITRAKSRSASPRPKSRSSSWSLPKSPNRRSCSWSRSMTNANEENIVSNEATRNEPVTTTEIQNKTN